MQLIYVIKAQGTNHFRVHSFPQEVWFQSYDMFNICSLIMLIYAN